MSVIAGAWSWLFRRDVPQTLFQLAKRPRRKELDRLYVVRVDFPVTEEMKAQLRDALATATKKFDLDFIVLEPGIKLQRFDEL